MNIVNPVILKSFETQYGTFTFFKEDGYNKPCQVEVRDRFNCLVADDEVQNVALEIFSRYLEVEHGCQKCTAMSLIWGGPSSATLIFLGTSLPNDQIAAKIALCTIGALGAALSMAMGRLCYPRGEPEKIIEELNSIDIPSQMRPSQSFLISALPQDVANASPSNTSPALQELEFRFDSPPMHSSSSDMTPPPTSEELESPLRLNSRSVTPNSDDEEVDFFH